MSATKDPSQLVSASLCVRLGESTELQSPEYSTDPHDPGALQHLRQTMHRAVDECFNEAVRVFGVTEEQPSNPEHL